MEMFSYAVNSLALHDDELINSVVDQLGGQIVEIQPIPCEESLWQLTIALPSDVKFRQEFERQLQRYVYGAYISAEVRIEIID